MTTNSPTTLRTFIKSYHGVEVNNPKDFPSHLRYISPVDDIHLEELRREFSYLKKKYSKSDTLEIYIKDAPRKYTSSENIENVKNGDFNAIKQSKSRAEKDLLPIYEHIRKYREKAFTYVENIRTGKCFYYAGTSSGCVWSEEHPDYSISPGVNIGLYSQSTDNANLSTVLFGGNVLEIPSRLLQLLSGGTLSSFLGNINMVALEKTISSIAKNIGIPELKILIPVAHYAALVISAYNFVLAIGSYIFLNFAYKTFVVNIDIYNLTDGDLILVDNFRDNAIVAGEKQPPDFKNIVIPKRIKKGDAIEMPSVFPPGELKVKENSVHNACIVLENDAKLFQGLGFAIKFEQHKDDAVNTFNCGYDCPMSGENKMAIGRNSVDCKLFYEYAEWVKKRSLVSKGPDFKVTLETNYLSGAPNNEYQLYITPEE